MDSDVDPDLLTRVRVSPEFGTDPLWLTFSDEPVPLSYSPEWLPGDFGVPRELAAAFDPVGRPVPVRVRPLGPAGVRLPGT